MHTNIRIVSINWSDIKCWATRLVSEEMATRSSLCFLRFDYKSLTTSLHHRNKVWWVTLVTSFSLEPKLAQLSRECVFAEWEGKSCAASTVKITFSVVFEAPETEGERKIVHKRNLRRWFYKNCLEVAWEKILNCMNFYMREGLPSVPRLYWIRALQYPAESTVFNKRHLWAIEMSKIKAIEKEEFLGINLWHFQSEWDYQPTISVARLCVMEFN